MEDPHKLLRRLRLGREEYCQRLLTMLVLDGDYPPWNTRSTPSTAGLAFLRALDELSFGAADLPEDTVFVDELDLPRRSEDEPGCAPDYGVLTADRLWIIELKTERGSNRSGQVESYFELGRHHHPDRQTDLTYLTPGMAAVAAAPLRQPAGAGDLGPGEAAHRRGLVGILGPDARGVRRTGRGGGQHRVAVDGVAREDPERPDGQGGEDGPAHRPGRSGAGARLCGRLVG